MTDLLAGKNFLVTGAANSRSIAWSVALAISAVGRTGRRASGRW